MSRHPCLDIIANFETMLAEYCYAPYAVAVDSGTNALLLCALWTMPSKVVLPEDVYPSVISAFSRSGSIVELNPAVQYYPNPIQGSYGIADAAKYLPDFRELAAMDIRYCCLSFTGPGKPLAMPKGGAILTNNVKAYHWFLDMRFHGTAHRPGLYCWMPPEHATIGIRQLEWLGRDIKNA